jgi:hypothetical protein
VRLLPEQEYQGSRERFGNPQALQEYELYVAATYMAGVAFECMLRAYISRPAPFDDKPCWAGP